MIFLKFYNIKILSVLLGTALLLSGCATTAASSSAVSTSSTTSSVASSSSQASAATGETKPVSGAIAGVNAENYPRIDGSTANLPLMAKMYSEACGMPLEEAQTAVEVNGTSSAWRNMINGDVDLLVVYEAPETVKEELKASNVKLEITPVGRDGLVFLVNSANKVSDLTRQQLIDIYTGKTTDWGALGGDAGSISAFQRNAESGSQTLFLKLLMQDITPMNPPTELAPAMMGALIDAVANYDGSGGAIGFSVFYYANEMYANPALKLLAVDGVAPTSETIGSGSYPLVNDFYLVLREDAPKDSPARLVRDWMLTEAGKTAMVAAGYIPMK